MAAFIQLGARSPHHILILAGQTERLVTKLRAATLLSRNRQAGEFALRELPGPVEKEPHIFLLDRDHWGLHPYPATLL